MVVKGIMRGADAVRTVVTDAAAIQMSNQGGRQTDGVPAGTTVLAEVVDAVGGHTPVLVDGGARRGIDVVRALALDATVVALVRPVLLGATVAGASGVAAVPDHLRDQLRLAMLLAGAASVAQITHVSLRLSPTDGGAR